MGEYGYGPGLGGRNTISQSGPLVPTYGGGGSSQPQGFQPRGFPESIRTDQFIGPSVEALDKYVFRGPAYMLERPVSLVSEMLGMPQGESILDPVSSFFEDLPVVGEHLSNAGKGAESLFTTSQDTLGSVLNAPKVQLFQNISNLPLDAAIDPVDALQLELMGVPKNKDGGMTPADVRAWSEQLGFTANDWSDLAANRKGWFDFPRMSTAYGAGVGNVLGSVEDIGQRLALDPVNIALIAGTGGGGILAKGGMLVGGVLKPLGLAQRGAMVAQSSMRATKGLTSLPALGATEAAAAVAAGQGTRATLDGLSMFLKNMARGKKSIGQFSATPAGWYRRVAVGTTAGQVGINSLDAIVPDDGVVQDALEPLFEFAAKMGERKPLSNNDLFVLGTLMTFPARGMISSGRQGVKRVIDPKRRFSHAPTILKALYPELEYEAARATLVGRIGESSYNAAMEQILKASLHEKHFLEGIGSIAARYAYASLSELGFNVGKYNESMALAVRRAMETGYLTPQDAMRGLRRMTEGRGDVVPDLSRGVVKQYFEPEDFIRSWEQWEPRARQVSEIFPEGGSPVVVGINDTLLDDGVQWTKVQLDLLAVDGKIVGRDLARIVNNNMPLLGSKYGQKFSQAMTTDGKDVMFEAKELHEALNNMLAEESMSRVEYFASQASREGIALRQEIRPAQANRWLHEDGTISFENNPANSQASVVVMSNTRKAAHEAMAAQGLGYTDFVRSMRANPDVAALETGIPRALEMGGSGSMNATQIGMIERGSTKTASLNLNTGLDISVNPGRPISDLIEDGALALEATGADRVTIVVRGQGLIKAKGVEANGYELQWQIARDIPAAERDNIAAMLERFGDRVYYNDTTGLIRVIVPKNKKFGSVSTGRNIHEAIDALGTPENAQFAQAIRDAGIQDGAIVEVTRGTGKNQVVGFVDNDGMWRASDVPQVTYSLAEYVRNGGSLVDISVEQFADIVRNGSRLQAGATFRNVDDLVSQVRRSSRGTGRVIEDAIERLGQPTRSDVHFRDILNHRRKVNARDPAGSITLADAIAKSSGTRKYWAKRSWLEDAGFVSGPRAGRVAARAKPGRAQPEARDVYSDRAASGSEPTRWERGNNDGRIRVRSDEHAVVLDDAGVAEFTDKLNAAGLRDTNPILPFRFRPGDQLFTTAARDSGAVVRADGELVIWLLSDKLGRKLTARSDFGSVISSASEHATWARTLARADSRGNTAIDYLAEHGWGPVAKSQRGDDTIVYLIRDPDQRIIAIPTQRAGRTGGWQLMQNDSHILDVSPARGLAQVKATAESLYGERIARSAQAAKDELLVKNLRRIEEIEAQARAADVSAAPEFTPEGVQIIRIDTSKPARWGGDVEPVSADAIPSFPELAQGQATDLSKAGKIDSHTTIGGSQRYVHRDAQGVPDGVLVFEPRDGVADYPLVVVRKDMQRQGIASSLYKAAEDAGFDMRSGSRTQTDAGAWFYESREGVPPPSGAIPAALKAEYDVLIENTSTRASKARTDAIMAGEAPTGNFTFIKGLEDDLEIYRPRMDESIEGNLDGLAPDKAAAVSRLEGELRRDGGFWNDAGEWVDGTDYTLKVVPQNGTPYYIGQGDAYVATMQGREALVGQVRDRLTSKYAQTVDLIVGSRYGKGLAAETRQATYNELLNKGATTSQANGFIAALRRAWETQDHQFLGAKPYKSVTDLSPNLINQIARGTKTQTSADGKILFTKFDDATIARVGDFADMIQRSGSRTFRNMSKKYPATPGSGNLGRLIEQWYGKGEGGIAGVGKVARRGTFNLAFGYHILRFILDPRWYAMNLFEADILSMARYGHKVRQGARAKTLREEFRGKPGMPVERDRAVDMLGGKTGDAALLSPEEVMAADSYASGWLDSRNLYGYIRNSSRLQRPQIARKMLQDMIDNASLGDQAAGSVIRDLKAMFGDDQGTWIKQLEDQLYGIDNKGIRPTLLSDPVAVQMQNSTGPVSKFYDQFLQDLFEAHRKNYQDIVHTFHGNVNRSNLERLANNPLLWWPISYQLKAGKWVIDLMTKQFAGVYGHEMLGSATLYTLMGKHNYFMENNEEYRAAFEDHPALWRTLAMMLPMTPFDMGVMMGRWTRYSGSWIGAQLGLWDQDPSYPQDPYNFIGRSFSLGPAYSWDIVGDILDEFNE